MVPIVLQDVDYREVTATGNSLTYLDLESVTSAESQPIRDRKYSAMLSSPRGLSFHGKGAENERQSATQSVFEPPSFAFSNSESWKLPINVDDFDLEGLEIDSPISWAQLTRLSP